MDIKILGSGCKKCTKLYELVCEVANELGVNVNIEKVEEFKDIVSYGVMKTPGLVVDGDIKASGRIPSKKEIKEILGG